MTPHTRPETTPAPDVVVPTSDLTPAEAWEVLAEGNRRFVAGEPSHPNQNAERRSGLTAGQAPVAVIFGCAHHLEPGRMIGPMTIHDTHPFADADEVHRHRALALARPQSDGRQHAPLPGPGGVAHHGFQGDNER